MFKSKSAQIPQPGEALPGRSQSIETAREHFVFGTALQGPFADHVQMAMFGLGCFWGAERKFWQLPGVISTAVGYSAGHTPNATYEEVCSGHTGHNEVVRVVFDPQLIDYETLLIAFFEAHNPTQGMAQGNDRGTQYRSGIYTYDDAQKEQAETRLQDYQQKLAAAGHGAITTEVMDAPTFYFAEDYHQQYLAKNPNGYCGLGGTGVSCG
ncbi:MAG: peptide-methionine (S)-S-oxide reductase MsrA [Hyphomicrobiaceae bacterium]|nr:peptide-methionine (S)-S-oxide reductase MsrA [Hyphomicrobiaceae bacterium]